MEGDVCESVSDAGGTVETGGVTLCHPERESRDDIVMNNPNQLTSIAIALLLSLASHGQTLDVTDSGRFVVDASGRYVRLEGRDGVVVEYLYDAPDPTKTSGTRVRVNDKLTLTVKHTDDEVVAAGLPRLASVFDFEGRTTTVLADGKAVAQLEYTQNGYFAAVSVPGRFTWKSSAPDALQRVRQTVQDASGQTVATAVVKTSMMIDGIRRGAAYDAAAEELGVDLKTVTYESSPTGALVTARDAKGRVAFYVVQAAPGCDVGFSADGKPRFYDFKLSVEGGETAPGGDLVISETWEGQRGTYPDHFVLTARGAAGVYANEAANGAIDSAWVASAGKVYSRRTSVEQVASGRHH